MSTQKPKVGVDLAVEALYSAPIAALDDRLTDLGNKWLLTYAIRMARAKAEGNTSAPPSPPLPEGSSSTVAAPTVAARAESHELALTMDSLVTAYQAHGRSPFREVKYSTRRFYESLCRQLVRDLGSVRLAHIDEPSIRQAYDIWTEGGTKRLPIAMSLARMMRMLFSFGSKVLNDRQCERLVGVMSRMAFAKVAPRSEPLTLEYAGLIRKRANEIGKHSIALAQAFQFDCPLKQKDVIGEWVPIGEDGLSEITTDDGRKWVGGLRWEEIDKDLILRRPNRDPIDLNQAPMVKAELLIKRRGTSGPVILNEHNQLPWIANEYRRWWRKIADKVGVPKEVKNMDSRHSSHDDESHQEEASS